MTFVGPVIDVAVEVEVWAARQRRPTIELVWFGRANLPVCPNFPHDEV